VSGRSNKRAVAGFICCLTACAPGMAGCELDNAAVPRVIPGPSVPSPVALRTPYAWDAGEELAVWIENSVSRGSFSIDRDDSNGAIAIHLAGTPGGLMILRGPNVDPPADAVRAVRIRYQWFPATPSHSFSLSVAFEAINAPNPDQPRASATLRAGPGWQEIELAASMLLDVRYVYFWSYTQVAGLLKIDAITLVR
jgi:hypothetical protein